jgi:hypothetical protein
MIKIRGRDGGIREVVDDYVPREGEALVVEMPFIHSGRGRMIDDDASSASVFKPSSTARAASDYGGVLRALLR